MALFTLMHSKNAQGWHILLKSSSNVVRITTIFFKLNKYEPGKYKVIVCQEILVNTVIASSTFKVNDMIFCFQKLSGGYIYFSMICIYIIQKLKYTTLCEQKIHV